ncbi:MAG: GLPGLI family protein [Flavobacteriaceae bacterium]|nr:GLPGLI family protein [Flavobacteriaceae bacterium]
MFGRIIFFLIFSLGHLNVLSQENIVYEVNYINYFEIDNEKFNSYFQFTDEEIKERNRDVFTSLKEYVLFFDHEQSEFNYNAKLNNSQTTNDRIRQNGNEVVFHNNSGLILYRNLVENFALIPQENNIFVQDSLIPFHWNTYFEDEKEILGYKVKKATTKGLEPNTNVIAWYTVDLQVQHGPFYYWGLPGLILKIDVFVNDNNGIGSFINSYHYEATSLKKPKKNYKFQTTENAKILNQKEYDEKQEAHFKKQRKFESQGVDKRE